MLAEDKRLPAQTRRMLLRHERHVRPVQVSSPCPPSPMKVTWNSPGTPCMPGVGVGGSVAHKGTQNQGQLKSFLTNWKLTCTQFVPKEDIAFVKPESKQACSLLWREMSSLSSKAACSAKHPLRDGLGQGCLCCHAQDSRRTGCYITL